MGQKINKITNTVRAIGRGAANTARAAGRVSAKAARKFAKAYMYIPKKIGRAAYSKASSAVSKSYAKAYSRAAMRKIDSALGTMDDVFNMTVSQFSATKKARRGAQRMAYRTGVVKSKKMANAVGNVARVSAASTAAVAPPVTAAIVISNAIDD